MKSNLWQVFHRVLSSAHFCLLWAVININGVQPRPGAGLQRGHPAFRKQSLRSLERKVTGFLKVSWSWSLLSDGLLFLYREVRWRNFCSGEGGWNLHPDSLLRVVTLLILMAVSVAVMSSTTGSCCGEMAKTESFGWHLLFSFSESPAWKVRHPFFLTVLGCDVFLFFFVLSRLGNISLC